MFWILQKTFVNHVFWILQKDFSRLGVANNNDFSDQSSEGYESECVCDKKILVGWMSQIIITIF